MHEIREHGGMGTQCTVEPGGAPTTTKKAMGPQCTAAPCCRRVVVVVVVVVLVLVLFRGLVRVLILVLVSPKP